MRSRCPTNTQTQCVVHSSRGLIVLSERSDGAYAGCMTASQTNPAADPSAWTTRRLLAWISKALQGAGVESPRLCGELLVAHVIGCDRLQLYVEADRPASPSELDRLRALVARALKHEPVQYLVETGWFFSLPMRVNRHTLVPRPETETIVEAVLQSARAAPASGRGAIADIGTGSGCIIVALLKNLPESHGIAVDISEDALAVARENAARHGVLDRLDLLQGDRLTPLEHHPGARSLDFLVSNPPYIPDEEWEVVPETLHFEPAAALRGGPDGLQLVRPIIETAGRHLKPGGMLAVEIAESTVEAVLTIATSQPSLCDCRIEPDFQGRPRILIARRRDT